MSDERLTLMHPTAASWRRDAGPVLLHNIEAADVSIAVSGIQSIVGVLIQHHVDADCDGDACLRLGTHTLVGLNEAIAACAELIEMKMAAGAARQKGCQK